MRHQDWAIMPGFFSFFNVGLWVLGIKLMFLDLLDQHFTGWGILCEAFRTGPETWGLRSDNLDYCY